MKFKVGDWVMIKEGCAHDQDHPYNPRKTPGKIVKMEYGPDTNLEVEWINGRRNRYNDNHLDNIGILNNPLNKKLYPNRIEYKGFLIPAEIADKLIEGEL